MLNFNSQDFRINVGEEDSCGRYRTGKNDLPTAGTAAYALMVAFVFGGGELDLYTSSVTAVMYLMPLKGESRERQKTLMCMHRGA